jgi:4-hydroxythreonine-4-phosphate dehydrogenase
MADKPPLIGITIGDLGGIGPEIVAKVLTDPRVWEFCRPWVFGDEKALLRALAQLKIKHHLCETKHPQKVSPPDICLYPFPAAPLDKIPVGAPSPEGGKWAAEYITRAAQMAIEHKIDAVTTAPLSKEALNLAGVPYPGHTELLASLTRTENFAMMMVGGKVRAILVTIHIPLAQVPHRITRENVLQKIMLGHESLYKWLGHPPHLAVASLNPHAGEGGLFGKEELEVIAPAVEAARHQGVQVEGPYPADTLFYKVLQGQYDAVVVMYHDQGLIPVKMIAFGQAVNVTLGLPIIRTSVDHGTAYDIAGKGVADPGSLWAALRLAAEMAKSSQ